MSKTQISAVLQSPSATQGSPGYVQKKPCKAGPQDLAFESGPKNAVQVPPF